MPSLSVVLCCATLAQASYPPAPWAQHGTAYVQELEVDVGVARGIVPMELGIVETKKGSGKTAGSIYVVRYGNASTVEYSEFIFIPATVAYRGATGSWASHVFVDSAAALQAGREVWGFNKTLGTFEWDRNTNPKLQHVKLTDARTGALVFDAAFDDDVLVTIPGMSQTVGSFGAGATAGAAAGQPPNTVVLSETKQKYGVKIMSKPPILNVPDASPIARAFAGAARKTAVAMVDGAFSMTAPTVLGRPSRAKQLWRTTPEVAPTTLPVTRGAVPAWLRGALIRNSAGGYANGADEMRHWNDGWAQLHRWQLSGDDNGGAVVHASRWLNTSSYHKASTEHAITQTGYGTPANPGARPHVPLEAQAPPPPAANATALSGMADKFSVNPMVNVWKFDDKYMATTDQNIFVEFDPETLETLGDVNAAWDPDDEFSKKGGTALGVAHGRYDRHTKEHYWLEIDMGQAPVMKAKYNIWTYQEVGHNDSSSTLPPRL